MRQDGTGGPVYSYIEVEEAAWVRHPGLPGGNYVLRHPADMAWLFEHGYIQVRDNHGRAYDFELTQNALDWTRPAQPGS